MRYGLRASGLAVITALVATVMLLRPGTEPAVAAQAPAEMPADLALVPVDAAGFVHVRAAELWNHELLSDFRKIFEKAGPKALAALDAQFVPKVSTFERATVFLMLGERERPLPYLILRFSAPFDPAEVVKTYVSNPSKTDVGGKIVYYNENADFEMFFPDNRHIVVSMPDAMARYLRHSSPRSGAMSNGLKLAAAGKPVVASLNLAALPIKPRDLEMLPPEARPLLRTENITLSLDLGAAVKVDVVASYKSEADAQGAEKAIKALAEFTRKELASAKADLEKSLFEPKVRGPQPIEKLPEGVFTVFALGAINHVDEMLANPGAIVKRKGSDLTASVSLPKELVAGATGVASVGAALVVPAVAKLRGSAAKAQSLNNLKQITLACINYADTFGNMPHDIVDKNGKPILSWRVSILPFIEQDNLYKQFKLDEPWDSENNKKWSDVAIKVYMSPLANPFTPPGMTHYKGFAGPGTAFEPGKVLKFPGSFPDGTSNTILVAEAGDPVPWAKPADIPFDPKKPVKLALPGVADHVNVALCDGSVRTLNMKKLSEKTLRDAITRDDGNVLGKDWDEK